jgi:flagellum-specific ATP synthase
VLVEGDDTNEPISDTVRGIIDGHIVLSRKIAARNHYPAIDILGSISRLMTIICPDDHNDAANRMRDLLALYDANYDLITIGAYKKGTNPKLDEAIDKIDEINAFLKQKIHEAFDLQDTVAMLKHVIRTDRAESGDRRETQRRGIFGGESDEADLAHNPFN